VIFIYKIFLAEEKETKIIGGWLGDQLHKAGDFAVDKFFDLILTIIEWAGAILLYASIVVVAFGIYCLIFQYKKPLKIGFIMFLISMVLIVIGGAGL
jgi:hypothetical protein